MRAGGHSIFVGDFLEIDGDGRQRWSASLRPETLTTPLASALYDDVCGAQAALLARQRGARWTSPRDQAAFRQLTSYRERLAARLDVAAALRDGQLSADERAALHPTFGFERPRDFLQAVLRAESGDIDSRLTPLAAAGSDEQGAYSDPHGGFMVPDAWISPALGVGLGVDPSAGGVTVIPMRFPRAHVNARVDKNHATSVSGGLQMVRRPETVSIDPVRMQMEQIELRANELWGFTFATERVLQDSPGAFLTALAAAFETEHAGTILGERLHGSGVGECLGVLHPTNGALIVVAKESAQAPGTILGENVARMAARCWHYPGAVWIANHDARAQIMSAYLPAGTSAAPVQLWRPGSDGWPDTLAGRPLFFTEHAATLGDQGDLSLVAWSEYLHGDYQPLEMVSSIHVRYLAGERAFRFSSRNDGRPWWRVPLTPKNGANTLSPFVTLAARA